MIEIRPGTEADRPQILERMEEVFGAEPARRAERLWDWQWHQDPRLPSPGYHGVVAEWEGRVIGVLTTIPAGLHIGGEPVQAWWFVDVLVHWGLTRRALREHRRAAAQVAAADLSQRTRGCPLRPPGRRTHPARQAHRRPHDDHRSPARVRLPPRHRQPPSPGLHSARPGTRPGRGPGGPPGSVRGPCPRPRSPSPALPVRTPRGPLRRPLRQPLGDP